MLCSICLNLFIHTEPLPRATFTGEKTCHHYLPHHLNSNSLQDSARLACEICCELWNLSSRAVNCYTEVHIVKYYSTNYLRLIFRLRSLHDAQQKEDGEDEEDEEDEKVESHEACKVIYHLDKLRGLSSYSCCPILDRTKCIYR
jgi:hypothetical protein